MREYREVQSLAKRTIDHLRTAIRAGMTEKDVRSVAEEYMLDNGADGFWYHGVGAFVLAGERSVLSMSGREYRPSDYKLKGTDLVTVDLSPRIGEYWGDYARTLVLVGGSVLDVKETSTDDTATQDWLNGLAFEKSLHSRLMAWYDPDEPVSDLFARLQGEIQVGGYNILDFNHNLGHTIEKTLDERRWFDGKNHSKMGDWPIFTFEPHIARPGARYGFKYENIYYYSGDQLIEL